MTPGKRWIAAIVCLLAVNVLAMIGLAVTANDGASKIVPGYAESGNP